MAAHDSWGSYSPQASQSTWESPDFSGCMNAACYFLCSGALTSRGLADSGGIAPLGLANYYRYQSTLLGAYPSHANHPATSSARLRLLALPTCPRHPTAGTRQLGEEPTIKLFKPAIPIPTHPLTHSSPQKPQQGLLLPFSSLPLPPD